MPLNWAPSKYVIRTPTSFTLQQVDVDWKNKLEAKWWNDIVRIKQTVATLVGESLPKGISRRFQLTLILFYVLFMNYIYSS